MRSAVARLVVLFSLTVVACENRDPTDPFNARQTRDPSDAFAKPTNSTTVQVGWTDSAPNETGFRIERSATGGAPWGTAGSTNRNVTTFSDAGRASEQQVCYRVFALFKNDVSNPTNTACTVPPAAATGLTAIMVDHQAIDLAWTDNSAVEDGYQIERATAQAGPYAPVAFVATNATHYRESGLTTNTTYWYRVLANNDGGFSDVSNTADATPAFTVPAAPSGLSARPWGGEAILISWVDNATNETGFSIERSLDQGATWTTVVNYNSPNTTTVYDYNRVLEQQVCYRVMAYNAQGSSPPSSVDCTAPPAPPTDLSAAAVDLPAIDLAWKDNSAVEDGYEVWRYDGITASRLVATLPPNITSYRDASVSVDQQYSYNVRATKDGGASYSTNVVNAVVATTPPNAPSATNVFPNWSSTAVAVYWDDNSTNEQSFRIERSTNGGASWDVAGTAFDAYYGFSDGGRTPELEVCYRVIASNARGDSPPSPVDCTVPPAGATNLTASWTSDGVVLNWIDNSSFEISYEIVLYTVCSEQPDYWLVSLAPNTTSYVLGPVSPWEWCGDYPVAYVVVTNDGGYGDFSNGVYTAPVGSASRVHALPTVKLNRRP